MANLSITSSAFGLDRSLWGNLGGDIEAFGNVIADEALVPGDVVRLTHLTSGWHALKADCTSFPVDKIYAFVTSTAKIGKTVGIQTFGHFVGATVTPGTLYILSHTAGKLKPLADLATGNYLIPFACGVKTTHLRLIYTPWLTTPKA